MRVRAHRPTAKARAKRLKTEEDTAAASKISTAAHHKTLHMNAFTGRTLDIGGSLVVSAGDVGGCRDRLRKIFGRAQVLKKHSQRIDSLATTSKTIVWFFPRRFMREVIAGRLGALPDDDLKSACLSSRLLGGYIADDEWLQACEEMHPVLGQVPQPIVRLEAAVKKESREVVIHASVATDAAWAAVVLSAIDCAKTPLSTWSSDRLGRILRTPGGRQCS